MAVDEKAREKRKEKKPSELFDRRPPVSLEAELAVLGSILMMPDCCDDVILICDTEDFFDDANRTLFRHIKEMHDTQQKIDPMLLRERLISSGDFELVGGASYLIKLMNAVATPAHATHYAKIVREKATFRALITASTEIMQTAYDEGAGAKEALGQAEQKIFSILNNRSSSTIQPVKEILHEAIDRIEARLRGEQTSGIIATGFSDFDQMTGGLHASELIILAARPSMGKTALAMNIGEYVAMQERSPVLFVSLEMSSIELIERMLCSVARVNGHRLRNGTIQSDDRKRLVKNAGELSKCPFFVDDAPSRTVSEIAAAARRIQRKENGLGLIVVDYLQLIEPDNSKDPRQEQVAKIARRLKGLARELKVPVLCLSQLNRQAEDARDHRPRLSHLRESGAIEQDADVVMFVHREEYYVRGEEQEAVAGQAQIFVEKQRNGPTGDIDLLWKKEFTRFEDRAPDRFDEFDDYNAGGIVASDQGDPF
ncbi:MAG: replicative DNA helicase [Planctomycetota bacterium]|nr:replicative DNA helicase [Planctomycetota bacterium]